MNAIELRVLGAQVDIRYVPPAAGNFQRVGASRGDQNSAAGARSEIERGGVALREVDASVNCSSAEFNERRDTLSVRACVPAQNAGIKSSAGNPLWRQLGEDGNEVGAEFEAASAPTAAKLAGRGRQKPRRKICASENELVFSSPGAPPAQTPRSQARF